MKFSFEIEHGPELRPVCLRRPKERGFAMISLTHIKFLHFQAILWLCFFAAAIFAPANAVAAGMAISKVANSTDQTIIDSRIDAVRCQAYWNEFQPTSSLAADTSVFEDCVSAAFASGKLSILQLDFAPADTGSGKTAVPQWSLAQSLRVVSDPDTNEFPVWWDSTYQTFAKAAITRLTDIYDADARVAGYLMTGYSGVLPTSLAGEQSVALCDNFQGEGYNGLCPPSNLGDDNTISQGGVYGIAVRDMMTHWAISTTKTLVYVSRNPVEAGTLTEELEANPVGLYTHIAVVNNGLNQCDAQNDIIPRLALSAAHARGTACSADAHGDLPRRLRRITDHTHLEQEGAESAVAL